MSEQRVWGVLGRLVEMIGSSELRSGAAECPYGVVREVVLATRGAPATCLIAWGVTSALKRESGKGREYLVSSY